MPRDVRVQSLPFQVSRTRDDPRYQPLSLPTSSPALPVMATLKRFVAKASGAVKRTVTPIPRPIVRHRAITGIYEVILDESLEPRLRLVR